MKVKVTFIVEATDLEATDEWVRQMAAMANAYHPDVDVEDYDYEEVEED